MPSTLERAREQLLRELAPQVLGAVIRRFGDFAACEDAVQEALLAAATQWPLEGSPENPRGWLIQVAFRRVADHVRAEAARRRRESIVVSLVPPEDQLVMAADSAVRGTRDESLDLLFMCCHPALSPASAIALTLRAVGGLSTAQIARAFMVPEATMAQRISRAKQSIKALGVAPELPDEPQRAERLSSVLHVLYLMFNEGYASSAGARLQQSELCAEAIRLTRSIHESLPEVTEAAGLLALMQLTDARGPARTGPLGELIPIDEQDRNLWDARAIAEGVALLSRTLPLGRLGAYQIQAAIAALHDEAPSAELTDWPQILALYEILAAHSDNPMIRLSHSVATAMVHGPAAGLEQLKELDAEPRLAGHHRLHAVRAHLLERAGDRAAAVQHYQAAASSTTSIPERDYLITRAARLRDG